MKRRRLRRSWFFRLFSLGALFIFTILNIGFFSPIGDETMGDGFNFLIRATDESLSP